MVKRTIRSFPQTDTLDYGSLTRASGADLVLEQVRDHGLPGNHHFICLIPRIPTQLADWLKGRYPEEMTVVIQHWFDNLEVREDGFSITLNFGDQPEPIQIPLMRSKHSLTHRSIWFAL